MVADTQFWDPIRAIVVSGLIFLAAALLYYYAWMYWRHGVIDRRGMAYGALSATFLILPAIFNQASKFGASLTWRLPLYALAVIFGILALHRKGGHNG